MLPLHIILRITSAETFAMGKDPKGPVYKQSWEMQTNAMVSKQWLGLYLAFPFAEAVCKCMFFYHEQAQQ